MVYIFFVRDKKTVLSTFTACSESLPLEKMSVSKLKSEKEHKDIINVRIILKIITKIIDEYIYIYTQATPSI